MSDKPENQRNGRSKPETKVIEQINTRNKKRPWCLPRPSFFLLLHHGHPGRLKFEKDPVIPSRWPGKYPPRKPFPDSALRCLGSWGMAWFGDTYPYILVWISAKGNAWGKLVKDASYQRSKDRIGHLAKLISLTQQ